MYRLGNGDYQVADDKGVYARYFPVTGVHVYSFYTNINKNDNIFLFCIITSKQTNYETTHGFLHHPFITKVSRLMFVLKNVFK